jgi:hypothetical protein
VHFAGPQGDFLQRLRVTYAGGYFFETLEPSDEGYPTAAPEGAAALPDDLQRAWVLQCQAEMRGTQLLDGGAGAVPSASTGVEKATGMDLQERVKEILKPYRRFS